MRYQAVVEFNGPRMGYTWKIKDTELGATAYDNPTPYKTSGQANRIAENKARRMNLKTSHPNSEK